MLKRLALGVGLVFLLIGILGFVPGISPEHSDGHRYIFGLFEVHNVHNVIHILSGLAGISAGLATERASRLYFQIFGFTYAIVTVIGLIQGDTVLGLFDVNGADNALHAALAVLLLGIGLGVHSNEEETRHHHTPHPAM